MELLYRIGIAQIVSADKVSTCGADNCSGNRSAVLCHNLKLSIVHYPLSIIHYPLLIALLLFAFVGFASAQENYTVIVKCPVVGVGTSIISSTYSVTYNRYHPDYSASRTGASYSYSTGGISANRSTTASLTYGGQGNSYHSSWSTLRQSLGFVNFNIAGIPNSITALGATMTLKPTPGNNMKNYLFSIYGLNNIPANSNSSNWAPLTNATTNGWYNYYITSGTNSYTIGMWNSNTYISSYSEYSVSSTYSTYTVGYKFFHDLTSARANNVTSMGMAFSNSGFYTWNSSSQTSFSINSNSLSLNVQYSAPWSRIMTPAAKVSANASSTTACAGSGTITLSASQNYNNQYVPLSAAKTWQWYSATNGSNGAYVTMGGTFTVNSSHSTTVQVPANTGSVWYKYSQTVAVTTNANCSPVGATSMRYTISRCSPACVLVSQCCQSLGGNPSFSVRQTRDRSVHLEWSGMSHVDYFVIRYGVDGGVSCKDLTVPGTATSQDIDNLTNGRSYYFQIKAYGASGSPSYCDSDISTKIYLTPECNE